MGQTDVLVFNLSRWTISKTIQNRKNQIKIAEGCRWTLSHVSLISLLKQKSKEQFILILDLFV